MGQTEHAIKLKAGSVKAGSVKVGSVKIANTLLSDYALKFLFLGLR